MLAFNGLKNLLGKKYEKPLQWMKLTKLFDGKKNWNKDFLVGLFFS